MCFLIRQWSLLSSCVVPQDNVHRGTRRWVTSMRQASEVRNKFGEYYKLEWRVLRLRRVFSVFTAVRLIRQVVKWQKKEGGFFWVERCESWVSCLEPRRIMYTGLEKRVSDEDTKIDVFLTMLKNGTNTVNNNDTARRMRRADLAEYRRWCRCEAVRVRCKRMGDHYFDTDDEPRGFYNERW